MKLASLETLSCDAGWRPWLFVKATTDDGLVGWSEVTDSHGSPTGLAGVVRDLAPLVVGRDPRAVEAIHWDLYRRTRQSPGSIVQKAIGGIENALLDLKGKALDVSVAELFGGPTRETVPLYWSHCGTTRARAWEVTGTPKLHDGRLYVPVSSAEEFVAADPKYPCCTFRGSVVALDAASGEVAWQT